MRSWWIFVAVTLLSATTVAAEQQKRWVAGDSATLMPVGRQKFCAMLRQMELQRAYIGGGRQRR